MSEISPVLPRGQATASLDADRLPLLPLAHFMPHRPPMLLVDAAIAWDEETLTCVRTVAADDPFLDSGALPAIAVLESLAQAIAAQRGLIGVARGEPVRPGVLVGCRDVTLHVDTVSVGETLSLVVTPRGAFGAIASYDVRASRAGALIAEAHMQVAVIEDPEASR